LELLKPSPKADLHMASRRSSPLKVAIISGKGGVGKTSLSANLAVSVASRSPGVLLMDCDVTAGQAHLLLGLSPCSGLAQVVRGERTLKQVLLVAGNGLYVAPGGPNGGQSLELEGSQLEKLVSEAHAALPSPGIMILDAGPSRIPAAMDFARSVDLTLVISTPEPTSIRSTVALLEALCCGCPTVQPWVLINMASNDHEANDTYQRIRSALLPMFEDTPQFFGCVPLDTAVPRSVRDSVPFAVAAPESYASRSLGGLAESLVRIQADLTGSGPLPTCAAKEEQGGDQGPGSSQKGQSPPEPEGLDDPEKADEDEDGGRARAA
jgi:flagellar biosynthesis protein FlhG